jgi:hypothetical protein
MIIVGGKFTGKKLMNAIGRGIVLNGSVEVAALSDRGVDQINKAGQRVANLSGWKVSADAIEGSVVIDGKERVALIVKLTRKEEN